MCLNDERLLCECNEKQKQMFWEFVFDNKHGGRYSNHWTLKGFKNSYINSDLIFLFSFCLREFISRFHETR